MPCDKMTRMTSAEIRQSFLEYFRERGHRIVASSPLVPGDDPTLLFTNAGMNQFKDLFLGNERREYRRATTSQKCMRVSGKHNDLENVGPSLRHHTFFEMLGNFSFGDYFKADAIPFAWELLTGVWNLPAERLYATVFKGEDGVPRDDEAYAIWERLVPASRIAELGAAENFWAMGETGPCGRCSEIHYHRGDHLPCTTEPCIGIDCDCDRYVEIWNNVFMEFERRADGSLTPLPAPSIDTGMGLERIVAVLQDKLSNYDTDLFIPPPLRHRGKRAGTEYGPLAGRPANDTSDVSLRVIADHLRAMTFLIADGVVPSNEWRGYVLRKIMRRAMRHGKKLGLTEPFLHELTGVVIAEMAGAYPELDASREVIASVVRREEAQFDRVLREGTARTWRRRWPAPRACRESWTARSAFRLYDTFGVPRDFIEDMAQSRSVAFDEEGVRSEQSKSSVPARAADRVRRSAPEPMTSEVTDLGGSLRCIDAQRREPCFGPQRFDGYETTSTEACKVTHLFHRNDGNGSRPRTGCRERWLPAKEGYVGPQSDAPSIWKPGVRSRTRAACCPTEESRRRREGRGAPRSRLWPRMHLATVAREGELQRRRGGHRRGRFAKRRDDIRRNHTATHLLHAALRQNRGHARQAEGIARRPGPAAIRHLPS